jgi:hypothetical protein
MRQAAGDKETEDGIYIREYSGGISIVNASGKHSFEVSLPQGRSYTDLDRKSVRSPLTVPPRTGLILLKSG